MNEHRCRACGCCNPTLFDQPPPERCEFCGTVFERIPVNRGTFKAKQILLDDDDTLKIRRVDNPRRTRARFRTPTWKEMNAVQRLAENRGDQPTVGGQQGSGHTPNPKRHKRHK